MSEKKHTRGPWKVVSTEHPHYKGGKHIERRIFTVWEDGQLKDCYPVVNISVGIGKTGWDKPRYMVHIEEADAYLIAAAPDLLEALEFIHINVAACSAGKELSGVLKEWDTMARVAIAKAKGGNMSYHNRIMNIPCNEQGDFVATALYKFGHRDARHAAAEIANEADAEIEQLRANIEALEAKVDALAPHDTCGCSYDKPGDICMHHSPEIMRLRADKAELFSLLQEAENIIGEYAPGFTVWLDKAKSALTKHGESHVE